MSLLDVQKLFIVHMFQFVWAGMLWTALAGSWVRQKSREFLGLWAVVSLLALSTLGLVGLHAYAMVQAQTVLPALWVGAFQVLRLLAAGLFLALEGSRRPRGWLWVGVALVGLSVGLDLAFRFSVPYGPGRLMPTADVGTWLLVSALVFWGVLAGLAFYLDRVMEAFLVRFFIRLNVVFIVLAAGMMFLIAELQWRQFLRTVSEKSRSSAELIRGYVLHHLYRGLSPEAVLTHPDVVRSAVIAFGEVLELREIRLALGNARVVFAWKPDGSIDQRSEPSPGSPRSTGAVRASPSVWLEGRWVRLAWPVEGASAVGSLEFIQLPWSFSQTISRNLFIVFGLFTLAVAAAGLLVGVVLLQMERLIDRQRRDLMAAQEQLVRAARLAFLGELASGIAHEINTPAGVIATRSEFIRTRLETCFRTRRRIPPLCAECFQDLDAIQRQALRIGQFVQNLLDLARPRPMQVTSVDLVRVVQQSLELLRDPAQAHGIRMSYEGPPTCWVEGDPARLEQAVTNVVKNAIEAMPSGGEVRVILGDQVEDVRLMIRDDGPGIPPEALARIWEPFYTTKPRGAGLGLSIVRNIVQAHGGEIRVRSEPGKGTEFEIFLPKRVRVQGSVRRPETPVTAS
ncbi:Sensor protein ZraS [bacterium HR11]|nr:Sensor protein ZraS [bacterium HR11]